MCEINIYSFFLVFNVQKVNFVYFCLIKLYKFEKILVSLPFSKTKSGVKLRSTRVELDQNIVKRG